MRAAPRICTFVIALALVVLPTAVAYAQIPPEVGAQINEAAQGAGATQDTPVELIVARIINATFALVGVTLLGFMVWAGYLWMTAGGSSDQVEKAQTMIRNAIIGLIITLAAYGISRFVITALLRATSNVR